MEAGTDHLECFTTRQALARGWTRHGLVSARRSDQLAVVRPGVYLPSEVLSRLDVRQRHLVSVYADQLALGSHWLAARRSAAAVFGLPMIGALPEVPQLLTDRTSSTASTDRHRRIARIRTVDCGTARGLAVVSPARVVVDIAREESFRNAVVVADAVLAGGVAKADLRSCLDHMERWPGTADARRVVEFADGLSESVLESISRVACHGLGMPPPELQVEVWLGTTFLGVVDNLWREFNTVGEADGFGKYGEDVLSREQAFRKAKRRTEALEDVGLEVVHWGWEEAWRPAGVMDARLRRAFERGRQQVVDPRVRFVTTTVADRQRRRAA